MNPRRKLLALGILGGTALLTRGALAADCPDPAVGNALLERYIAALNAHDTSNFGSIHTESYIQNSGRGPSGLAAQVETFRGIFARMPDVQVKAEDRIIAGDRVVARMVYAATHSQPLQGIAPTGKRFNMRTI